MVPHSQNVAYSNGDSQILWEDGERVFRRGWRLDDDGKRRAVLLVTPAADHPSRSNLDRLTHEYELKDELDRAWAVRPLELVRDAGRTMLVLEDADGEPLDRLLGAPMQVGRFLQLAIGLAVAVGKLHERGLVHKDIKPGNGGGGSHSLAHCTASINRTHRVICDKAVEATWLFMSASLRKRPKCCVAANCRDVHRSARVHRAERRRSSLLTDRACS